ncbi:MAG: glucuronyl hydrolase [Burkholderiaceae bacterium]
MRPDPNSSNAHAAPRRRALMAGLAGAGVAMAPCAGAQSAGESLAFVEPALRASAAQITTLLTGLPNATRMPRTVERGALVRVQREDWTSGFFPGVLWLLYEATGEHDWREAARRFTRTLEPLRHFRDHHDVGFMLGCSYGNALRLAEAPGDRAVLVDGARALATRFDPRVGLIRSWDHGGWAYPVIIDNLMNLELLIWASREAADPRLLEIAVRHADGTLAHHCRPDGSAFHLVDFDPATGAVRDRRTVQGAADGSAWARGQAWGLYGFTAMYRETRHARYLAQAERMARFVMDHPRLPADRIPYWDFDAPGIPNAPRDASAGAIIAGALLELATLTADRDLARRAHALAREQLRALSSPAYFAARGENGGFLLRHSVGALPHRAEIDVPLVYADYYFLEAMLRLRRAGKRS